MAKNSIRGTANRLLNSTEKQALSKLMKVHQPMLKELEKWKEQREKLETTLFDQVDRIGKFLEPYGEQIGLKKGLAGLSAQQPKAKYSSKRSSSSKRTSSKPKARSTKKSR